MQYEIRVTSSEYERMRDKLKKLGNLRESQIGIDHLFEDIIFVPDLDEKALGVFYPESRLIAIDEKLLSSSYPGSFLEGVFLHELAHALEYKERGFLSGHSPVFRECCRRLGLDEGFAKSKVSAAIDRNESLRRKRDKLIALSSSPFREEAESALRKAQSIVLDEIKDGNESQRLYYASLHESKRTMYSTALLISFIAQRTGVFYVRVSENGIRKQMVYGSLSEVELSIYLHSYLSRVMEKEIAKLRKDGMSITSDSFTEGFVSALDKKAPVSESGKNALIAIGNENRELAMKLVFSSSRLRKCCSRSRRREENSREKGYERGKETRLPASIERRHIE
ncbi:MAG: hypothetical protein SPJ34_08555 [Candidatus Ornithospirochaeta sp.]|nr:hypothetical protein [Candidatus Ornithospirochaeta sp.]